MSTNVKEEDAITSSGVKKKKVSSTEKKYVLIHCTGYLKSWPLTKVGLGQTSEGEQEDSAMCCLVAVGRLQPSYHDLTTNGQGMEFSTRHATDGNFTLVDQRASLVLGYLTQVVDRVSKELNTNISLGQELLGTSLYELIHADDIPKIIEVHKRVLQNKEEILTPTFRLKTKSGKFLSFKSKWKQFRNPWTKDIEYIICKNHLLLSDQEAVQSRLNNEDFNQHQSYQQTENKGNYGGLYYTTNKLV